MLKDIKPFVDAGLALHWLHRREKRPIGKAWAQKPTATFAKLKAAYEEGFNVGVRLGEPSYIEGLGFLHCIDLDIRDPESAAVARQKLKEILAGFNLKLFPMVRSGSGGASRHIYFFCDKPLRSRKLARGDRKVMGEDGRPHLNWEIELLGGGKQAAFPPSIHPSGLPYTWGRKFDFDAYDLGVDLPILPASLFKGIEADDGETDEIKEPLGLSAKEVKGLLADLPEEWCDDHDNWFRVGMALHHEFGGGDAGLKLWNDWSKQSEKYEKSAVMTRWPSFGRQEGGKIVTMATVVSVARDARRDAYIDEYLQQDLDDEDDDDEEDGPSPSTGNLADLLPDLPPLEEDEEPTVKVPKWIKKFNKSHCVAVIGNKVIVIDDSDGDPLMMRPGDFHTLNLNRTITVEDENGKAKKIQISQAWIAHEHRRTVRKVAFIPKPGVDPTKVYNLWKGWAVAPSDETSCKLILKHIREVVCNGDRKISEWLLDFLAHMFQRPWEKPGVAIVMKGKKGAGKDTLGTYLGKIGGEHYVKVNKPEHIYGQFNAHIAKSIMLHAEEGFWAGDKKHESAIKNLITDPRARIEPKGIDSFEVDSFLRLFMSSNERWVVPASFDERRFLVLDVSSRYMQDFAYFTALYKEMTEGGPAALLAYLLARDIEGFDPRNPPVTSGLIEQKRASLRGVPRWWDETLQAGTIPGLDEFNGWNKEVVEIQSEFLREAYGDWLRGRKFQGEELSQRDFGFEMREVCPSMTRPRPRINGRPVYHYRVPDLKTCRKELEKRLGGHVEWEGEEFNES